MRKVFFLFIIIQPIFSSSETNYRTSLIIKLQRADSIKLISHRITEGYAVTPETSIGKPIIKDTSIYPLLINDKINPKVIIESKTLSKAYRNKLVRIFDRDVWQTKMFANCDEPQHSILIYKNNKLSYIDICFGCRRIHTSKDIDFSESNMELQRWDDILLFFKSNSLNKLIRH